MEPEIAKLRTLLYYTIEHSKEHTNDLKDIAQKAIELGETTVYVDIMKGIEQMKKANEILENALKRLRQYKSKGL